MILYLCIFIVILAILLRHRRTTADPGKNIDRVYKLHPGETMILELDGNATTGYRWDVVRQVGNTITLEQPFLYYTGTIPPVPGQGGWYTTIVTASTTTKGTTLVELSYHPSWEPTTAKPTMTIQFDVM